MIPSIDFSKFLLTRQRFLLSLAALAGFRASKLEAAAAPAGKVLLVVAHPDDEYTFAATVYRLTKELGYAVDQVVITNGAGGYRYSQLAEQIYGVRLSDERAGKERLPAIRKQETIAAGRILGIRRHYFLDQQDGGYTLDPQEAPQHLWNAPQVRQTLEDLMRREQYQFVLTLLPTEDTHGHHQSATRLAIKAAQSLPAEQRPAVLGGEPAKLHEPLRSYSGHDEEVRVWSDAPVFTVDRTASFGYRDSLNYQIVVNWVIAEHKSQGLFQTDCLRHEVERFWLFAASGPHALGETQHLFTQLSSQHQPAPDLVRR